MLAAPLRILSCMRSSTRVEMPFGPTFWSPGFGMVNDRFGKHWIIGAQLAA